MFGQTWNHNTIRKYIVLFGTLFNNIYINRQNNSGETVQTIKVPLSYGPKEKFLARAEGDPTFDSKVAIVLPRMSFEMVNFRYAAERKLNRINKIYKEQANGSISSVYQPVPYDIEIVMSVMVKNAEDGTKIIEQILPYFTPDWTATVELLPEIGGTYDVPIILNQVQVEDTYAGSFDQRRAIIWNLAFTIKGYMFGPVKKNIPLIKMANVDFRVTSDPQAANTLIPNTAVISTRPGLDANGNPTTNSSITIDYTLIKPSDNYTYIINFIEDV